MAKKHILLCGERRVGKSVLIERLAADSGLPVYGFVTDCLPSDETGFHPIHIHPADRRAEARVYTGENLLGTCDTKTHNINLSVFETLGTAFIRAAKPGGLIIMDELGFMEADAGAFTAAVFDALDGDIPVLAAVKARYDVPFLNAVRAHKNADVYDVTIENRDALYESLAPLFRYAKA